MLGAVLKWTQGLETYVSFWKILMANFVVIKFQMAFKSKVILSELKYFVD